MNTSFVRSRTASFLILTCTFAMMTACGGGDVGSSKLKPIHSGMPRDSVLRIMGTGPLSGLRANAGRIENGYRKQGFLINGRIIEVLWYRTEPGDVTEYVKREQETPIVLTGDTVTGWGWDYYVKEGPKLGLPYALAGVDSAKAANLVKAADSANQAKLDAQIRARSVADSLDALAHPATKPTPPVEKKP